MSWDYAELSKAAKNAGGPEKLVDTLIESGKQTGRTEMAPWLVAALAVGSIATWGVSKLRNHLNQKKAISEAEVEKAKAEIIQGINDYDAEHADVDAVNSDEEEKAEDKQSIQEIFEEAPIRNNEDDIQNQNNLTGGN